MKKKQRTKSTPIMVECEDCQGKGEVQARCNACGKALTTANQADMGSEGLCEDYCAMCLRADAREERLDPRRLA